MKGIADTGFIVAFANRSDAYHDWALGVAELVTDPLLTCEPVLAEAAFHLQSVRLVLDLMRVGLNIFSNSKPWPSDTRIATQILQTYA
jgi:hypothetical protein